MTFSYGLAILVVIGMAIFAIQNSGATPVQINFLVWGFETSLIYTILGSMGLGILITIFFWIPRAIRSSLRSKELRRQLENLETALYRPATLGQAGTKSEE
jgi:putative membrane protein